MCISLCNILTGGNYFLILKLNGDSDMTEPSFDKTKTIRYWLECADYDLETGKSLMKSKRFPYALFSLDILLLKRY